QVVVEQVELAVGHVEIVGDWIPHGLKMVKILLLTITILIGENDFARYRVDLDLHAGMEIEVAFTDLRRGQRDVRRPVYVHVSRRAWRQRRNRDGADFQPARGITYPYSRRIGHEKAYVGVDGGGISTITHMRVDPVFVIGARIVSVADYSSVGTAAVAQAGRANCIFIAVGGAVHPDVHRLVSVHGRG